MQVTNVGLFLILEKLHTEKKDKAQYKDGLSDQATFVSSLENKMASSKTLVMHSSQINEFTLRGGNMSVIGLNFRRHPNIGCASRIH